MLAAQLRGSYIPVMDSETEGIVVDRIDQRIWYVVAAVVVLLLLAWFLAGSGAPRSRHQPRPP